MAWSPAYRNLLIMHPHIIGHRSRLSLVEELIEYIRDHDGVWFATHEQIARYCLASAPFSTSQEG